MSPVSKAVWGPACWTLMHSSAANCNSDSAEGFSAFLYSLAHILPCPECRAHLYQYLQTHPPEDYIIDAHTASRFCFELHNFVNAQTGKVAQPPSIMQSLYDMQLEDLDSAYRASGRIRQGRGRVRSRTFRML